jgi:hypothetical protein
MVVMRCSLLLGGLDRKAGVLRQRQLQRFSGGTEAITWATCMPQPE